MPNLFRSRLFLRQFLSFFAIIIVSFVGISAVLLTSTRITLKNQQLTFALSYQKEVSLAISRWVEAREVIIRSQAELLSHMAGVEFGSPEFASFLNHQFETNNYFSDLVVIDGSGTAVGTKSGKPGTVSLRDRDYVKRGLEGLPTTTGFLQSSRSNRLIMVIACPIYRDDRPAFVLSGIILLETFREVLDGLQLGSFGTVRIVDRNGIPFDEYFGSEAPGGPTVPETLSPAVRSVITGGSGIKDYSEPGVGNLTASYEWLESLGAGLVVELNEEEVLKPVSDFIRLLWAMAILVLFAGLVMALMIARTVVLPVNSLIMAAGNITSEKYQAPLSIRTNSELDLLIEQFNIMQSAIQSREDLLRRQQDEIMVQKTAAEEANRMKSRFLANMSHELRTPLNSIIGFTNRVIRKASGILPDVQRENLEIVKEEGQHLLTIINDILDFSKIEAGKMEVVPEEFDLRPLVEETLDMVYYLRGKKPLEFRIEMPEQPVKIFSDRMKIKQILLNLLSNAVKYSEHGVIEFSTVRNDPYFQFTVRDEGIGIAQQDIPKIFSEFSQIDGSTTRRAGGTGLGLSITRKFVEMLGGRIDVASVPGSGSVFMVHLPITWTPEGTGSELTAGEAEIFGEHIRGGQ